MSYTETNPLAMDGLDFIEFAAPDPDMLHRLFQAFGLSRTMRHKERNVDLYQQNDVTFLVNREEASFAGSFKNAHGPCVSSMGWRVADGAKSLAIGVARGAKASVGGDYARLGEGKMPALVGIGESLIYLVDDYNDPKRWEKWGFVALEKPDLVPSKGFTVVDHLTNNVYLGTMGATSEFYKTVFGFTEVKYFDIRGAQTGLTSFALRSACGKFCIPINEAKEKKSQINEYLDEYKGPGVQHIAFLSDDILGSLDAMKGTGIETLEMDEQYYQDIKKKLPQITEDWARIQGHQVLADGDENGYLLQIFTKNVIGPIFFEIIQRKNCLTFGDGNFGALFRSIEREQAKRGVFDQA